MDLEGGDTGAAVILPVQLPVQAAGIYWFVFEVSGRELTRVPLQIIRPPAAATAQAEDS